MGAEKGGAKPIGKPRKTTTPSKLKPVKVTRPSGTTPSAPSGTFTNVGTKKPGKGTHKPTSKTAIKTEEIIKRVTEKTGGRIGEEELRKIEAQQRAYRIGVGQQDPEFRVGKGGKISYFVGGSTQEREGDVVTTQSARQVLKQRREQVTPAGLSTVVFSEKAFGRAASVIEPGEGGLIETEGKRIRIVPTKVRSHAKIKSIDFVIPERKKITTRTTRRGDLDYVPTGKGGISLRYELQTPKETQLNIASLQTQKGITQHYGERGIKLFGVTKIEGNLLKTRFNLKDYIPKTETPLFTLTERDMANLKPIKGTTKQPEDTKQRINIGVRQPGLVTETLPKGLPLPIYTTHGFDYSINEIRKQFVKIYTTSYGKPTTQGQRVLRNIGSYGFQLTAPIKDIKTVKTTALVAGAGFLTGGVAATFGGYASSALLAGGVVYTSFQIPKVQQKIATARLISPMAAGETISIGASRIAAGFGSAMLGGKAVKTIIEQKTPVSTIEQPIILQRRLTKDPLKIYGEKVFGKDIFQIIRQPKAKIVEVKGEGVLKTQTKTILQVLTGGKTITTSKIKIEGYEFYKPKGKIIKTLYTTTSTPIQQTTTTHTFNLFNQKGRIYIDLKGDYALTKTRFPKTKFVSQKKMLQITGNQKVKGFYEYNSGRIVVSKGLGIRMTREIVAHERIHFLQHQKRLISKMTPRERATFARSAGKEVPKKELIARGYRPQSFEIERQAFFGQNRLKGLSKKIPYADDNNRATQILARALRDFKVDAKITGGQKGFNLRNFLREKATSFTTKTEIIKDPKTITAGSVGIVKLKGTDFVKIERIRIAGGKEPIELITQGRGFFAGKATPLETVTLRVKPTTRPLETFGERTINVFQDPKIVDIGKQATVLKGTIDDPKATVSLFEQVGSKLTDVGITEAVKVQALKGRTFFTKVTPRAQPRQPPSFKMENFLSGKGGKLKQITPKTLSTKQLAADTSIKSVNPQTGEFSIQSVDTSFVIPTYYGATTRQAPTTLGQSLSVSSLVQSPLKIPLKGSVEALDLGITQLPVSTPKQIPSQILSQLSTQIPSQIPTQIPSQIPAQIPSQVPAQIPAQIPSQIPTQIPTQVPTDIQIVTEPITSKPIVPIPFWLNEGFRTSRKRPRGRSIKRPKKFKPSLVAVSLDLKGTDSFKSYKAGKLTGIEIRRIPI
jgi:hypothetical protein